MKKKFFTRPVSVSFSDDMFEQIKIITDTKEIGISDYIRDAIAEKLANTVTQSHLNQEEEKMNQDIQTHSSVSWKQVLCSNDDIKKLLEGLEITDLRNIRVLSRTYSDDGRMIITLTANNRDDIIFRIIIDSTVGIPTWRQFINVTYDQGASADIRIILYGKDYSDQKDGFTAGDVIEISNLVRRNNRCRVTTYLIKGITVNSEGQKILDAFYIEEGPSDVSVNPTETLPSKRQVQEAEFWTGYYFPNWGTDPFGIDDDIINDWAPGYPLTNHLRTAASWNDEGFFIKLTEEQPSDAIHWIWNNKKGEFEAAYPGCDIILEKIDEDRHAISVRILNISMTDLINMPPNQKSDHGEYVYGQEHVFSDLVEGILGNYNDMLEAANIA